MEVQIYVLVQRSASRDANLGATILNFLGCD